MTAEAAAQTAVVGETAEAGAAVSSPTPQEFNQKLVNVPAYFSNNFHAVAGPDGVRMTFGEKISEGAEALHVSIFMPHNLAKGMQNFFANLYAQLDAQNKKNK